MNASEFARKRARLERRAKGREAWLRKATAHLVAEAGAVEIRIGGGLVGWRMTDGGVVCVKRRYPDRDKAQEELAHITRRAHDRYTPVRVYRCHHCAGWHMTSQERVAANDNNPVR